jgi:hypothetical protein
MKLEKFSMGIGDRFGHQGKAQLQAMIAAKQLGVSIVPVWNKSNREHQIIGTNPADVRREADETVKELGWKDSYYVDADHINLKNVEGFIPHSNFFTLDVADYIGKAPEDKDLAAFIKANEKFIGSLQIPDIDEKFQVTKEAIEKIGKTFLFAVKEAGKIYRRIEQEKGKDNFVAEVSMDESEKPQSPLEMLFILSAIAQENIPAQTIAPKFTGRFNKGVDYVGDVKQFEKEFNQDIAVIQFAVKNFNLPKNLKLSVHSGSDKFSIYPAIKTALKKSDAGVHLKTAGTTWLEELIGLAHAGGEALDIAKEIYEKSLKKFDELCAPYATVIDIDPSKLPAVETVKNWSSRDYVQALQHNRSCRQFNPNFRQLLHVGYKVAAQMGPRYITALEKYEPTIAENVKENIFDRHIKRLFL